MRVQIILYEEEPRVFHPELCKTWSLEHSPHVSGYPLFSAALVCPLCLKLWARLEVEGEDEHEVRGIPCATHDTACHPDLRPVAGSLLDFPHGNVYDGELLDRMPPELIEREFRLTLSSILAKEIE